MNVHDASDATPWAKHKQPAAKVRAYFRAYPAATPDQCAVDLEIDAGFILSVRGKHPEHRRRNVVQAPIAPRRSVVEIRETYTLELRTVEPRYPAPEDCEEIENDETGALCASIFPKPKAKYCQPCAAALKQHYAARNAQYR